MRPTEVPPDGLLQDATSMLPSDPSAAPESQKIGGGALPSAKGVITPSSGAGSLVTPAVDAAPAAESEAASLSEGDVLHSLVAWINAGLHRPCTASCCGS